MPSSCLRFAGLISAVAMPEKPVRPSIAERLETGEIAFLGLGRVPGGQIVVACRSRQAGIAAKQAPRLGFGEACKLGRFQIGCAAVGILDPPLDLGTKQRR